EPKLSAAFQTPTPGNPLAFVLPVHDTVVAQFDTKGLALGTAVGVRTFIDRVVAGALTEGQAFFRAVLDRIADRIQAHPTSPLGLALLDTDGNGTLSAAERQPLADAAAFKKGLGAQLQALFQSPVASAIAGLNNAQATKLVNDVAAFVQEFLGALDDVQKAG